MRTNYQYNGKTKHREKWLMILICGPVFAAILFLAMFLLTRLPESLIKSLKYVLWPATATVCALLATGADRLGKRLNLTAQEFAAPVALSCTLCPLLAYALLWLVLT
ncbi:hypothetical protein P4B35_04175 [Pontiellaceae bacterium B12227]|nr:hypothetical protein [Pontiellaceae bacterium B12227]